MSLFENPKRMRKFIYGFLVLLVAALIWTTRCQAAEFDLAYGRTLIRGETDVASATVVWPKAVNGIDLYAGVMLIGSYDYGTCRVPAVPNGLGSGIRTPPIEIKPTIVIDVPCRYGNQLVARAGIMAHLWQLGVGLGVATMQKDDLFNSGKLQFNLRLSYDHWKHVRIDIDHFSNAGSNAPNYGRDMVSVGWRF